MARVGKVLLRIRFEGVLPGSQNHRYYTTIRLKVLEVLKEE